MLTKIAADPSHSTVDSLLNYITIFEQTEHRMPLLPASSGTLATILWETGTDEKHGQKPMRKNSSLNLGVQEKLDDRSI